MQNLIEIRPGRYVNIINIKHNSDCTLFFFHGVGGRSAQWRYQIAFFAKRYSIIAMDYLGHGNSLKPKPQNNTSLYNFEAMSADVQAVFNRYKTQHNFVMGHSYGGAVALHLASQQADIEKIILLAPLPYNLKIPLRPLLYLPNSWLQLVRILLAKQVYKRLFNTDTNPELILTEMHNNAANPIYAIKNMLLGIAHMPIIDLSTIRQSILIIASPDDQIISLQDIKNFYTQLPNSQFKIIKKVNHLMMLEKPEIINQLIDNFLKEK
ncbi:hypothetical protein BH10PSE19_BH10PSE19_00700 [soil metagenome]